MVAEFVCGAEECAESGAGERAADADALDSEGGEFGERKLHAGEAHDDIDGTVHGANDGGDVVAGAESGRIEDVGAGLLVGLEAGDGVREVGIAGEKIFAACGEGEGERKSAGGLRGSADALSGDFEGVDRAFGSARHVFDGAADDSAAAASWMVAAISLGERA